MNPYGNQFSERNPNRQIRVNASSLVPAKACPRKYELEILKGQGKPEEDPDLLFGTLLHKATAIYDRNKALGAPHEMALQGAFRWGLHETWDEARNKPGFVGDPVKNRASFLRTLIWYLDQYRDDPCETVVLPGGVSAVELKFEFDSGVRTKDGEVVTYVGTLDRIVRLNDKIYIKDIKTSSSSRWLTAENYSPNSQFSLYCIAGRICYGVEAEGIILDGIEVGVNGTKFHRVVVPRPKGVLEEWLAEQRYWIEAMLRNAEEGYWPQNDTVCGLYGGCKHRDECSKDPRERKRGEPK